MPKSFATSVVRALSLIMLYNDFSSVDGCSAILVVVHGASCKLVDFYTNQPPGFRSGEQPL